MTGKGKGMELKKVGTPHFLDESYAPASCVFYPWFYHTITKMSWLYLLGVRLI